MVYCLIWLKKIVININVLGSNDKKKSVSIATLFVDTSLKYFAKYFCSFTVHLICCIFQSIRFIKQDKREREARQSDFTSSMHCKACYTLAPLEVLAMLAYPQNL